MLSVAWPVALGPSASATSQVLNPGQALGWNDPAESVTAAAATATLASNNAVDEAEEATAGPVLTAAAAAKIHAARLEDALLLEVACNILEQVGAAGCCRLLLLTEREGALLVPESDTCG